VLPTKLRSRPIGRRALADTLQSERAVVVAQDPRRGQERDQRLPHPDRTGARPAAAVRRRERLVDVEVHDVEARLARLEPAEDGVQVGAIHVRQGARLVDRVEQLPDARLEQAERRRVGDHDGRGARTQGRPEALDVDAAVGGRRDGDGLESGHRRGRGVRAVAGVRDEHLVALRLAAGVVVGPDHQDPGQLALGAGRRLEADGAHAGDLCQGAFELPQQLEGALGDLVRCHRVELAKPGRRAAHSLSLGLNFIVHEPSG
jgi:hypothetical protein